MLSLASQLLQLLLLLLLLLPLLLLTCGAQGVVGGWATTTKVLSPSQVLS